MSRMFFYWDTVYDFLHDLVNFYLLITIDVKQNIICLL